MRLRDLDRACWSAIAGEIASLADEIAEDQHPDIPLEDVPEPAAGEWPEGSLAVEVWRALNQAATYAMFVASKPDITRDELAAMFRIRQEER